jgi:hypothetical protein
MESSGIDVERQLAGRSGIVRRSAKFGGLCTLSDTLLSCFSRRIRFPQCAYGSLQCAGGIRMINLFNLIEQADLDTDLKLEALSNAHRATAAERYILAGIFGSPAMWQLAGEIFSGAHVRIHDGIARYSDWITLPSADTRRSSHWSMGPQYHVDGPLIHTMLFGWARNWTWFQFEDHTSQEPGHYFDYLNYVQTKENQGPYGTSAYTEQRAVEVVEMGPYVPAPHLLRVPEYADN